MNPGQQSKLTKIELKEDDDVIPTANGNASGNDENLVHSASANDDGVREDEAAPTNSEQTTAILELPQHGYGTCSSRRFF